MKVKYINPLEENTRDYLHDLEKKMISKTKYARTNMRKTLTYCIYIKIWDL